MDETGSRSSMIARRAEAGFATDERMRTLVDLDTVTRLYPRMTWPGREKATPGTSDSPDGECGFPLILDEDRRPLHDFI